MIFFLYGSDTYRSQQKLKEIIKEYRKAHKTGLNLRELNCLKANFQDLKNEFQTVSMFDEKKLLVLKNIFSNSDIKENFLKQGEIFQKSKDIIVVYEEDKIAESDSLFKFLKKNAGFQEFSRLHGRSLKNWVEKEIKNYQTRVSSLAAEKLIHYIGDNLWQFSNELKKLVSFKKGEEIKSQEVELLVKPKIETDIFKTIDAIAVKDKRKALFLIHRHLEKGDNPSYLLSMINFQFRNILEIKDMVEKNKPYSVILKQSKLHPFVVRKSYGQAQKFELADLKKIYQRIFQADLDIKTGRREPDTALDLLIAGM